MCMYLENAVLIGMNYTCMFCKLSIFIPLNLTTMQLESLFIICHIQFLKCINFAFVKNMSAIQSTNIWNLGTKMKAFPLKCHISAQFIKVNAIMHSMVISFKTEFEDLCMKLCLSRWLQKHTVVIPYSHVCIRINRFGWLVATTALVG